MAKKELIILGKGPSRKHCPFDAEVWGVNNVYETVSCWDRTQVTKLFAFDYVSDMIKGMRATGIPIVGWQYYADEKYPLDEIVSKFGVDYFTNSISYMVAMAIYKGYEKIRLYGVDQRSGAEYINEKSGVEFWIGVAIGHGINVEISSGSHLLKTRYGTRYGTGLGEPQITPEAIER